MDKIVIGIDGGCHGNGKKDAIGGYGIILQYKGKEKEIYKTKQNTTSQRMELQACISALQELTRYDIPIEVWSDSSYLVNCVNQREKWYDKWINNGWRTSQKKPVENKDLWIELFSLINKFKEIRYHHIKGHLGHELNERAHKLAQKAIKELEDKLNEKNSKK